MSLSMLFPGAIPCWYDACDKKLKASISKFHDKVCNITDVSVHESTEQLSNVYMKKCQSLITKIVNDYNHSMHKYITVLPHGHLRTVKCRTEWFCTTFLPVAIKLYNAK